VQLCTKTERQTWENGFRVISLRTLRIEQTLVTLNIISSVFIFDDFRAHHFVNVYRRYVNHNKVIGMIKFLLYNCHHSTSQ